MYIVRARFADCLIPEVLGQLFVRLLCTNPVHDCDNSNDNFVL